LMFRRSRGVQQTRDASSDGVMDDDNSRIWRPSYGTAFSPHPRYGCCSC